MNKRELLNIILGLQDRETFLKSKIKEVQAISTKHVDFQYFTMQYETTRALIARFKKDYSND